MGEKGKPISIEQARKMRDGILKGDSAIAQAWKELIGSPESSIPEEEAAPSSSAMDRWDVDHSEDSAVKKQAELQRLDEAF